MLRRKLNGCLHALAGVLLAGVASTAAHAAAPTATNAQFTVYGFVQADYIYDFKRVDPAWQDTLRPSRIPTVDGIFGSDGESIFSAKQTRFGVKGDIPVGNGLDDVKFKFEFDLFGVGPDAGKVAIRLRHAYAEWGQFLAGQTNTLFMDGDIFPNTIDYWGPPGMAYVRKVQFRWTPYRTEHSSFAMAIEAPGNDIDAGTLRELDPALGAAIQNREIYPEFTTHFRYQDTWGHVQFAALIRNVAFDSAGTPDNRPKGSELGWGLDLSGHINTFGRDKLLAGVVYGQGIASDLNDGGVDLAPEGIFPTFVRPKAVPLLGVSAYYDHYWNDKFSTSLGWSITQVDNTNLQAPTAFRSGQYASINLLYTPWKNLLMGGEFLWGERGDNDTAKGDDYRIQFSVKYDFNADFTL